MQGYTPLYQVPNLNMEPLHKSRRPYRPSVSFQSIKIQNFASQITQNRSPTQIIMFNNAILVDFFFASQNLRIDENASEFQPKNILKTPTM
jgi:hypothetical protein